MTFIYQAKYIWLQVTLDMLCDTYQSDIREFWRILPTLFARWTYEAQENQDFQNEFLKNIVD